MQMNGTHVFESLIQCFIRYLHIQYPSTYSCAWKKIQIQTYDCYCRFHEVNGNVQVVIKKAIKTRIPSPETKKGPPLTYCIMPTQNLNLQNRPIRTALSRTNQNSPEPVWRTVMTSLQQPQQPQPHLVTMASQKKSKNLQKKIR